MFTLQPSRWWRHCISRHHAAWLASVVLVALVASACHVFTEPATPALRVHNVGTAPLSALIVGFPAEHASFGDVPPGGTSGYVPVAQGVYNFAYYSFRYEGKVIDQLLFDFMGANRLRGRRFTYNLKLTAGPDGPYIDLVSITTDR